MGRHAIFAAAALAAALAGGSALAQDQSVAGVWQFHEPNATIWETNDSENLDTLILSADGHAEFRGIQTYRGNKYGNPAWQHAMKMTGTYRFTPPGSFQITLSTASEAPCDASFTNCNPPGMGTPPIGWPAPPPTVTTTYTLTDVAHATDERANIWTKIQ